MDDPREIPELGGIAGPAGSAFPPRALPPEPSPQPAPEPPQRPADRFGDPTSEDVLARGEPIHDAPPEGVEVAPAPIQREDHPVHPYGTDKNYDDPADANEADVEAAIATGPGEASPQPFRKRDDFPDITSESVNIRLLKDYWPADTGRHQNGDLPRAREGELVAFPSDEAIALIRAGIGEREDDDAHDARAAQHDRWRERDEDRKRAEDEAKRRRDGA